ncbi:GntR family transcriptional regulator [Rhizobium lusitanum]|uniref:GntR family transcriptional regulator n=1 Tax=Rhizobium lusitanum TaxID=293958 RepID=UPI00195E3805|nr:GntR family transcriptional regulator [Rhizobium lusitanum]MBM7047236.1 GntR family transcriptional regulator [Rhizobium lusitanum]
MSHEENADSEARSMTLAAMVAALEEDIVLGRLHPRERLVEDELIARLGGTRHLVRQALMELDRIGLIDRIPNRGALVRSYTADEVEHLYVLRELLETKAASLIPLPLDPIALDELKRRQAVHDIAVQQADLAGIFRANLAFHRHLFGCCNNAFLSGAVEAASQRAHSVRFLVLTNAQSRETARLEHHAMIAAIENNDREALIRLCRDHLPASKLAYLRAYGSTR